MEEVEERLAEIRRTWQAGRFLGDGDIGWLIGQLEAALRRVAEYKDILKQVMAGVE